MIIAGVMSGSSLDGLDIAFVEFSEGDWSIIHVEGLPYSEIWEEKLRGYFRLSAVEYIAFKYKYAHYIGRELKRAIGKSGIKPDFISFHGHTLVHNPNDGYTEQIGNGGIIAGITGISTLTDFRSQDVALGGVGTPLAPYLDSNYLKGYDYYLNLGGIANVTIINDATITAYDICPCNQVLNYYSNLLGLPFDNEGAIASSGKYQANLADYFSQFDYFTLSAPKSLDNNWIREVFIKGVPDASPEDTLHTYCIWMASCIAEQVNHESCSKMYSTGGGSLNTYFMSELKKALANRNCEIVIPSREMIDYKEAVLMAVLAKSYLSDRTNVISEVTGASRDSIGGALYKV